VDAGLRRHDVVGVMLGLGCFHAWLDCRASLAMTLGGWVGCAVMRLGDNVIRGCRAAPA
jgi:hypothetical protein